MKHWFVAILAVFAFISLSRDSFGESAPKKVPVIVEESPLNYLQLHTGLRSNMEKPLLVYVLKDGDCVDWGCVAVYKVGVELRKDGKEFTSVRRTTDPNHLRKIFKDFFVPEVSLVILVPIAEDVQAWNEWLVVQTKLASPVFLEPRRILPPKN